MSGGIGVLGGTFDPIHFGHLITAQDLLEKRGLDKIIFIPCYISPHKTENVNSQASHRLNMTRLAISGYPGFECSSFEIDNGGVSFSIDTLRELKKTEKNIELIIGYDNLAKFYTWKEPDEILKLAKLVVMERSTHISDIEEDRFYRAAEFVKTPNIEISATKIRERVRNGLPIDFLVPQAVRQYIFDNKLYI
ncbi:MAG: nicotinate-nucleotide adenylyltransferase [Methanococcaceae archaeon]